MISLSSCSKSKRIFFSSSKRGDRDNCRGSGDRHCPRNLCNMASAWDCQEAEKGKVSWQQSTFADTLLEKGATGHPSLRYAWRDNMKSKGTSYSILNSTVAGNLLRRWSVLQGRRRSWPREGSACQLSIRTPVFLTRNGVSCDT